MKNDTESKTIDGKSEAKSLTKVLEQSEHVKVVLENCGKELSSVNIAIKEEVSTKNQLLGIKSALEKNQVIEGKVQEATDELIAVNQSLGHEIETNYLLEKRLNKVTQEEEKARHAAFHDALTGLPNRALFENRLEHGLAQAKRHGLTLAVMFIDIDNFKKINDTYGHDVGDGVLKIIAERLMQSTREDDTVSRFGGDEFMHLMMEFGDVPDVISIAEKITHAIQAPCRLSIGELNIKLSIGISIFPKDGMTGLDLIKSADKAMYEAKRNKSGYALAG